MIVSEGEYLGAFFSIDNRVWGAEGYFDALERSDKMGGKFTLLKGNILADFGRGDKQYQEPVFIYNVEFVDGHEDMLVRGGAIIGLYGLYECCSTLTDALYLSLANGIFETICVPTYGESKVSISSIPFIVIDQSDDHVIKARSKLMDDLTRKDRESDWWWGSIPLKNIFRAIEIHASYDTIRAWIIVQELVDLGIEIAET